MINKFSPRKYLNKEITVDNCNHEVVLHNCFDEDKNNLNSYHCIICDSLIPVSNNENELFTKQRSVYNVNDLYKNNKEFLKHILTYICYRYSNEKQIDLIKFFEQYKENLIEVLDYINNPKKSNRKKVEVKYRKLFKEVK